MHQFNKELHARGRKRAQRSPALVPLSDSNQQALFVAQRILELREEGMELNEMAVLYRSHFHALELQLELTRHGIPFSITSGMRFFEQAHIKDVAAFLKFVVNPRDEIAFKRMARLLPGIGGAAADKLWRHFVEKFGARGLARRRLPRNFFRREGRRQKPESVDPTAQHARRNRPRRPSRAAVARHRIGHRGGV